jgi:hypothetical protein
VEGPALGLSISRPLRGSERRHFVPPGRPLLVLVLELTRSSSDSCVSRAARSDSRCTPRSMTNGWLHHGRRLIRMRRFTHQSRSAPNGPSAVVEAFDDAGRVALCLVGSWVPDVGGLLTDIRDVVCRGRGDFAHIQTADICLTSELEDLRECFASEEATDHFGRIEGAGSMLVPRRRPCGGSVGSGAATPSISRSAGTVGDSAGGTGHPSMVSMGAWSDRCCRRWRVITGHW